MLTPAFSQIKGNNIRDVLRDIYDLIKKIIISIYKFSVWAYNKMFGTELSINWKIFWWCIGIIFVLGSILAVYAKVKKRQKHKKTPATAPKDRAESSKDMDRPATLACWKCQKSVPVAEYSTHVEKCILQKPQFRV